MKPLKSLVVLTLFLHALPLFSACSRSAHVVADGGPAMADGGQPAEDGGTVPADGGQPAEDGGTVPADGGPPIPPLTTLTFDETEGVVQNPERGFFSWINLLTAPDLNHVKNRGHSLTFSLIMLDAYRGGPLPATFLASLGASFEKLRTAGLKLVLRFSYNDGPWPNSEPDAPLNTVLEHIGQLAPLFQANADVILVLQAGFIGAWGEWHTSTNNLDTPENQAKITNAILTALPPSRMVQLRYPWAKMEMYGVQALTANEAFNNSFVARIGHHNDCFLASDSDFGTYGQGNASMFAEKAYLSQETLYVPMGGETCNVNPPRSECASALAEMRRFHYTYINEDYHPGVIQSWQDGGCYDTLHRELGYRLFIKKAAFSESARPGGSMRLELEVENRGFAAPINARPFFAVLSRGQELYTAELKRVDARRWAPPGTHQVALEVNLPADLPMGQYRLALWLPDASLGLRARSEYAIRLVNRGFWEAAKGHNVLTETFLISLDGKGDARAGAPSLVKQ